MLNTGASRTNQVTNQGREKSRPINSKTQMKNLDNTMRYVFGMFIGIIITLTMCYFGYGKEIDQLSEANKYKHELLTEYEEYRDSVECGASYDEITDRIDSLYLQEL